jgi:hypothetical protein
MLFFILGLLFGHYDHYDQKVKGSFETSHNIAISADAKGSAVEWPVVYDKNASTYLVLGAVWIVVADLAVTWIFADTAAHVAAQTAKGLVICSRDNGSGLPVEQTCIPPCCSKRLGDTSPQGGATFADGHGEPW